MDGLTFYDKLAEATKEFIRGAKWYANARKASDGEQIGKWIEGGDFRGLEYYRPFFRSIEGLDHTMFVIDVDTEVDNYLEKYFTDEELREIRLRATLNYFREWLRKNPNYKFTTYISGKGLYLVQKYEQVIDKNQFIKVIWGEKGEGGLFEKKEGWKRTGSKEISKIVEYEGIEVKLIIDLRMYLQKGGRLFRAPYSPYFKFKRYTYYCSLVEFDEEGLIDVTETIKRSTRKEIKVKKVKVYPFQFEEWLETDNSLTSLEEGKEQTNEYRRKELTDIDYDYYRALKIPTPEEGLTARQKRLVNKMKREFSPDPLKCPPCIWKHSQQLTDRFWSRVVTVRYLAHKGYTPYEVALYVRFVMNNEEDNLPKNRDKLLRYLPFAYGSVDHPNYPPNCLKMRDVNSEFYAVNPEECKKCGRIKPLEDLTEKKDLIEEKVLLEEIQEINKKPFFSRKKELSNYWTKKKKEIAERMKKEDQEGFKLIHEILAKVVEKGENHELIKGTRCGVTTTLINIAKEQKKKMLIIAPTNKIGFKTFPEAMEIGFKVYNQTINGAILANNNKSCLALKAKQKELYEKKKNNPNWGDEGLSYNKINFHFKPSCVSESKGKVRYCPHFNSIYPFPHINSDGLPYAVGDSEITNYEEGKVEGYCAYRTIMSNLNKYDIFFMTYDKLNAILLQKGGDGEEIINFIMNDIDILFFDEVSFLAQKPHNSVIISKEEYIDVPETEEVLVKEYDYVTEVRAEIAEFLSHYNYKSLQEFIEVLERFLLIIDNLISSWQLEKKFEKDFSVPMDNPLDEEDREIIEKYFNFFHNTLEDYAIKENRYLGKLEELVILLKEDRYYINNFSTLDEKYVCSITTSPIITNIRQFVRQFVNQKNTQFLVTDATMPLIKMNDLFGIRFIRTIVGDPRFTNIHQLIVPDSVHYSAARFNGFFGFENDHYYERLIDRIKILMENYKAEDIMIVLPNSRAIYRKIKSLQRAKVIDPKIQVTYYRSDKTIGVSNTRRVMLAVCVPRPPHNSSIWLANYYKDKGFYKNMTLQELSNELENMNAFQAFYQTIGRVKDPSNRINSIVYLYGITIKDLEGLLGDPTEVPPPQVLPINGWYNFEYLVKVVGILWREFQIIINPFLFRVYDYLSKESRIGKSFYISQIINDLKANKKEQEEMKEIDLNLLSYLGIEVIRGKRGGFKLRVTSDRQELEKMREKIIGGK